MIFRIFLVALAIASLGITAGCADNGPATGENVAADFQKLPAEERFATIKSNTGMGLAMKDAAIDGLPVSQEQKAAWKKEIREAGGGEAAPTGRP